MFHNTNKTGQLLKQRQINERTISNCSLNYSPELADQLVKANN